MLFAEDGVINAFFGPLAEERIDYLATDGMDSKFCATYKWRIFLASNYSPISAMLNSKQRDQLRDGLTPPNGAFLGKTYQAIALELTKRFGFEVSLHSVRHYVRSLCKQGVKIETPLHGWPKGKKRPQSSGKKPSWAFLYRELLLLTGLSGSKLHGELQAVLSEPDGFPSKRTFLEQLAKSAKIEGSRRASRRTRTKLAERCTVRLHQVALTYTETGDYWVLLAGYDQYTQFLNVAVFDIGGEMPNVRPPGRPKQAAKGEKKGIIHRTLSGDYVELSEGLWREFCLDTTKHLGLPVKRFEYAAEVGLTPTSWKHGKESVELVRADYFGGRIPSHCVTQAVFRTFKQHLEPLLHQHNQRRWADIRPLREKAIALLQEARAARPGLILLNPPFEEGERRQLLNFYDGENAPIQYQLRKIACRSKKICVDLDIQADDAADESE